MYKQSLIKENKRMYYTSLNADQLCCGDNVYVADNLYDLKEQIRAQAKPVKIDEILGEEFNARFSVKGLFWNLAYLVERKKTSSRNTEK